MAYSNRQHLFAILLSLLLVVPFFVLEGWNTGGFTQSQFPFMLFLFMLVNSVLFMYSVLWLSNGTKIQDTHQKVRVVIVKMCVVVLLGSMWIHIVADQMPCFLGATGC